jgi:hypothetical protein
VSEQIIHNALEDMEAGNWDDLKLLLHPYVHWTQDDGVTLRGRKNVLQWLASRQARLVPPGRFELRDGQIYRWSSGLVRPPSAGAE